MAMEIGRSQFDLSAKNQNYGSRTAQAGAEGAGEDGSRLIGAGEDGSRLMGVGESSSRLKCTADYARELAKLAPSVKFRVGTTFPSTKSGKTLTVHPKLLEKMQRDPKIEKDMKDMIKGVEFMTKMVDGIQKAGGQTVVYRHSYIDENGKYCAISYTRNEFGSKMSVKLRKERQVNSAKLLERQKERAAKKKERTEAMIRKRRLEEKKAKKQSSFGRHLDLRL